VVCGLPLYEYDHLLGWAAVQRHVAEEITLLCDKHHREKTLGILSNEAVRAANANPLNLQKGVSAPYDLHYSGNECQVIIGGNRFRQSSQGDESFLIALAVDGDILVGFRFEDEHYLLTVDAFDEDNLALLTIANNTLVFSLSPWDIAWVGRRLTIREGQRKFLLEMQFNPPNEVRIERGNLRRNGVEFRISPTATVINGKSQVSGNDFVGSWGVTVGQPHRRGSGYRQGKPLSMNLRSAQAECVAPTTTLPGHVSTAHG
jgi:hypothetical protein